MSGEVKSVIIGGGIGGLCTAIALRQIGIDAVVYEQAEELGVVGAGPTLWVNAIKALRKLGVADAVIASGSEIKKGEIRSANGRMLSWSQPGELKQLFGEPTIAIHRADLHHILCSALPREAIRLGAHCTGFEQDASGVSVHFADERTERADLLIGADGINSVIRQQLFPQVPLRYSGYTAWRGVVAMKDDAAPGVATETWGRGARFGFLRID
jgi:2-polyprenyl-6-methoxyphenol hydroxylase-like FAD-dependent oxidoreductase